MKKEVFDIIGMSCSACSARVEKQINELEGVKKANVNLLKNNMNVTFDEKKLSSDDIIGKVKALGFDAKLPNEEKEEEKKTPADIEMNNLKKRLLLSLIFTIPLAYITLGMMLGFPQPGFFKGPNNAIIFAFTQFLLALPVLIINNKYFLIGFKNLFKRTPNMDSLIAIGSSAAFIYGIYSIYKIGYGLSINNLNLAAKFSHNLYFDSSATILTLITLRKIF